MMKMLEESTAYLCGWIDGCYRELGCFTGNDRLAEWKTPSARLEYYRGHRAGRETRQRSSLSARAS